MNKLDLLSVGSWTIFDYILRSKNYPKEGETITLEMPHKLLQKKYYGDCSANVAAAAASSGAKTGLGMIVGEDFDTYGYREHMVKLGVDLNGVEVRLGKKSGYSYNIAEQERLGGVNLLAEEEAQDLEKKVSSIKNDQSDLLAAISKLREAIDSLNTEGRQRLLAAYGVVNENFQKLFVQLFGGGKAYLKFTDETDPLQAGLEIYASPPGKKMQNLNLLSGGEQALTALSLLFAVFLSNPAPICVLDEVDAPLDDTNVDRFCTLVEEIAKTSSTKFLVITHHRMTMARVNRLFGVTMPEQGVSQLVSVDLEKAIEIREQDDE